MALFLGNAGPDAAEAQRRVESEAPRERVMLDRSAPVANLFRRAEEGLARRDWKFAIDSLQRIIDDPGGALVPVREGNDALYESARRRAHRWLAAMPAEGLSAYRLLYDGRAKGLFDRAVAAHDAAGLETIVERYLLSRYGDDATELLAAWALDDGRPAVAIARLNGLREVVPDYDISEVRVTGLLAAAHAMLGRTAHANAIVGHFRNTNRDGDIPEWLERAAAVPVTPDESPAVWRPDPDVWPVMGGTPSRTAHMPAVDPTLADRLPWQNAYRGGSSSVWERVFEADAEGPPALPSSQLVADARRIFVRTRHGSAALAREDLHTIWAAGPDGLATPGDAAESVTGDSMEPERGASVSWNEEPDGNIAVVYGLVLTVERDEDPMGQPLDPRARMLSQMGLMPTRAPRLVARSAETGEVVWERGRTFAAEDPLGVADFRSVPIGVGGALWIPYFDRNDLALAVLDPQDGSLLRSILLCTVAEPRLNADHGLHPAYADDTVYVPTGQGVLLAVDADDHLLKWASRYPSLTGSDEDEQSETPISWLPSPPIIAGGLVLLAPPDSDDLRAFDAGNGALMWSRLVPHASYLIAADDRRAWVGGRSVTCLSLVTGESLWSTSLTGAPTGRAVRAGEVIYAPTSAGLVSIRAEADGAVEQRSRPPLENPLGNVLCLGSAMFSLDGTGVRKFPDIDRLYPQTQAEYEAQPSAVSTVLRLAWLRLLRSEPGAAHELLAAIPADRLRGDARLAVDVAHAQVEALLAMAEGPSASVEDSLVLLTRARETAATASDRIRCTIVTVDRLETMGRFADAWRELWQLGCGDDGNRMVSLGDYVRGPARLAAARRMDEIGPRLTAAERAALHEQADERVAGAAELLAKGSATSESIRTLRAVAEMPVGGSTRQHARLAMAGWRLERLQYEAAEQLYRSCIRLNQTPEMTATALMRLCMLYRQEAGYAAAGLESCLSALAGRFALMPLPMSVDGINDETATEAPTTIADWVSEVRVAEGLPAGGKRPSVAGTVSPAPVLTTGPLWSLQSHPGPGSFPSTSFAMPEDLAGALGVAANFRVPPRMIRFDAADATALTDRVVYVVPGDWLYCQDARTGALLWHTRLYLPETFPSGTPRAEVEADSHPRRAVLDGQIAVFNGLDGLYAVGLVTGKRLWVRPYDAPWAPQELPRRDGAMAAEGGQLAAVPRPGRLALLQVADGSLIWERELRGESVDSIHLRDEYVMTMDERLERVLLFDRGSGRLARRIMFRQPSPHHGAVQLVQQGSLVAGPDCTAEGDAVVAFDVESGEEAWRTRLEKPLSQLFEPADGYIGIGLLGGDIRIVKALTGEVVLERRVSGGGVVADGRMIDGTLLVKHVSIRGNQRRPAVTALDIATGDTLWHRDDLVPGEAGPGLPLVDGLLPLVVEYAEDDSRRDVFLTLIDLRTGEAKGPAATMRHAGDRAEFNGDRRIGDGVVIVGTASGVAAFGLRPPPADAAGGAS